MASSHTISNTYAEQLLTRMEPSRHQQHNLPHISVHDRESITWRVRSGFFSSDEIVDFIADQDLKSAKRAVRAVVAAEWASQVERQQSWPDGPTISDKLAKAFSSLERNHKILARMNAPCCQTCGRDELYDDSDDDTRGYVFFHWQDTERIVRGGDLYLAFGSFTKSEKKNRQVGNIIIRSLRRAGLSVAWEKDTRWRIRVRYGEWRRRFREEEDIEDVEDDDFDSEDVSSGESESELEPDTFSDLELDDTLDAAEPLV